MLAIDKVLKLSSDAVTLCMVSFFHVVWTLHAIVIVLKMSSDSGRASVVRSKSLSNS